MEQNAEKRSIVGDDNSTVKRQDTSPSKGIAHIKPEYIVPLKQNENQKVAIYDEEMSSDRMTNELQVGRIRKIRTEEVRSVGKTRIEITGRSRNRMSCAHA